ncbi:hypothetical protein LOTGIDRAFT_165810 [Lottia gigantea]|uniref:ubiquitinyl hydrolase 1 n=1 Tax=Lottia gigantea TaxID=225164 RepID=V4BIC9_LOTGI|nr:hypothetical protein LOTGIDRAFT_165810 [Lottia gigantea]ESO88369.1 hypothetical protein LOTGIDRAFT_165810 [Lottia gigantea]
MYHHYDINRDRIISEFVRNTLTDEVYAADILERNNWDLKKAYASVEKACKDQNTANHQIRPRVPTLERQANVSSSQQRQVPIQGTVGGRPSSGGSQGTVSRSNVGGASQGIGGGISRATPCVSQATVGGGLEYGYGVPVPNRSSNSSGQTFTPPLQRAHVPKFPVGPLEGNSSSQQPVTKSNERIIPIQVMGSALNSSPKKVQPRAVIQESYPSSQSQQVQSQTFRDEKIVKEKTPPNTEFKQPAATSTVPKSEPKLKRGISNIIENASLLTETRSCVLHDIEEDSHDHMYIQTFVLPDLTVHNDGFRAFLQKELVETSTLVSLEQAGRLNWWAEMRICQRLWPMATTGDGNCLLHAASLAMWGVHDRQLILRNALYDMLTKSTFRDALYRRWRWQQTIANKESGLVFSESEWSEEWSNLLRLASTKPRTLPDQDNNRRHSCCESPLTQSTGSDTPVVYESLEEFHVFVLSHVLERPIIVVADKVLKDSSGEALAPIPFGGIYLPLECAPRYFRSPLLLTYDAAHFSALVPMDHETPNSPPAAIPVVDPEFNLLPIHFHMDPGAKYDWTKPNKTIINDLSCEDKLNLLQKFMDVEKLPIPCFNGEDGMESDKNSFSSCDSDIDSVGCVGKGEKAEKKKEAKQMQSIGKQFGSIGKSVGKKFKKNFANFGKTPKSTHDSDKLNNRKASVGSVITQSTKVITTLATNSDKDRVRCAKLSTQRPENQQSMIKNYMQNARERYEKDRELKRLKGEELRSRVNDMSLNCHQTKCVTPNCQHYGTSEYSYMCSQCYNRQKSQIMVDEDRKHRSASQAVQYNTFPRNQPDMMYRGPARVHQYDDTYIYRHGKSKFYTMTDDRPSSELASRVNIINNLDRPRSADDIRTSDHTKQTKERSPSPDYDNVDYPEEQKDGSQLVAGNAQKCLTTACQFYGKPETDNLCSGCFKEKTALVSKAAKTLTRI